LAGGFILDSNQIRLNSGGIRLLVCSIFIACAFSSINAHGETPSIIGAWKPVKYMWTEGDSTRVVNDNPQPGLFIASAKFYSWIVIWGDEDRPLEPEGSMEDYTHDQLKSMSVPFVSNAGTYIIENNRFVFDPVVALSQNFQESGEHNTEFEISSDGNSIVFFGRDESGEVNWRRTWVRLE
jgi:hypothetical protein